MQNSANYPSLLEPGLRKKKRKKMERGELMPYDAARARQAEQSAAGQLSAMMDKKMGINRRKF